MEKTKRLVCRMLLGTAQKTWNVGEVKCFALLYHLLYHKNETRLNNECIYILFQDPGNVTLDGNINFVLNTPQTFDLSCNYSQQYPQPSSVVIRLGGEVYNSESLVSEEYNIWEKALSTLFTLH